MIQIFYGTDRTKAHSAAQQFLGPDYELIDGASLTTADLPSLFLGASLFAATRRLLIRDLGTNKPVFDELPNFLNTPHHVALLESSLDKRTTTYKTIKNQVKITEFVLPPDPNQKLVFNIYTTAKKNGPEAIAMLEKIKITQEVPMFIGLMTSQAIKDYQARPGNQTKRALKELSHLDLQTKSSSAVDPWLLVEAFLLKLSR